MRRNSTASTWTAAKATAVCLAIACALGNWTASVAAPNTTGTKTPAKKTATPAAPVDVGPILPPPTNISLSKFSTDNPRDPFHPQIKPKNAGPTVLAGPQGEAEQPALIAAVQAGFQGIYGAGEDRELLVYGVLLRENHETSVVVPVNGQQRKLKVKALKIFRNFAELQVEGIPQKVTVPKPR